MIELTTVLVATDFGESSDNALRYGRALARNFGATLHLLHVVDDLFARGLEAETPEFWTAAQREAEENAARRLAERAAGAAVGERTAAIVSLNPPEAIVGYAREVGADLIVMGTHGPNAAGTSGLGSVAERVVHTAPCPVLTVKHREHEFVKGEPAAAAADHV
jgi:nucleotide-binding universal stress UspA family protein